MTRGWDLTTWEVKELCQWIYVIGERSDRVISEAMNTDDWSDYDADESMYRRIADELARRGLNLEGKPVEVKS